MLRTSVVHSSFSIERRYPNPAREVFAAFADAEIKATWFTGPQDAEGAEYDLDFRVGGHEINRGGQPGAMTYSFESRFHNIVAEERIVFSYDMHLNGEHVSVSLTTVEFEPDGEGTKLTFTEQGAFFDGLDDPAGREHGTGKLLESLDAALADRA
jgi:uncharacterized protein YndB with AHSA1/START domain